MTVLVRGGTGEEERVPSALQAKGEGLEMTARRGSPGDFFEIRAN